MSHRKWKRGRRLTPIEVFIALQERRAVYFNHKWTHPGWALSWQINMMICSASKGHIFEAVQIEEAK